MEIQKILNIFFNYLKKKKPLKFKFQFGLRF